MPTAGSGTRQCHRLLPWLLGALVSVSACGSNHSGASNNAPKDASTGDADATLSPTDAGTDLGDAGPDATPPPGDAGDGAAGDADAAPPGPIDVSGTWDAVDLTGAINGQAVTCAKTSFAITQDPAQLHFAKRSFSCTYTGNGLPAATTYADLALTISGTTLLWNGQPAGTIDSTQVDVQACLSGSCTLLSLKPTAPNRLDYQESNTVNGNTLSEVAGKLFKQGTYTVGKLTVSPSPVDFGTISAGTSPTVTVTVSNTGGELAESIVASGPSGGVVTYAGGKYPGTAGTCGTSLAAGQGCTLVLQASPPASFSPAFSTSFDLAYSSVGTSDSVTTDVTGVGPSIQTVSAACGSSGWVSVGGDGNLALVGMPSGSSASHGIVAAYALQNSTWTQVQTLSGATPNFGVGVALSGTTALVADTPSSVSADPSTVQAYAWNGTQWAASGTPLAVPLGAGPDQPDWVSLRISGSAAVFGSSGNNAVAILSYNGASWSVQKTLTGTRGGITAISGDWVAVAEADGVHMFQLSGTTWNDMQTVGPAASSVALDGTTLAIGVEGSGTDGFVSVFTYDGSSWGSAQVLPNSSGVFADYFATQNSLGIRSGTLFVGAHRYPIYSGQFYIVGRLYSATLSGGTWSTLDAILSPETNLPSPDDEFGDAIAMTDSFALVSDPAGNCSVAFMPY